MLLFYRTTYVHEIHGSPHYHQYSVLVAQLKTRKKSIKTKPKQPPRLQNYNV